MYQLTFDMVLFWKYRELSDSLKFMNSRLLPQLRCNYIYFRSEKFDDAIVSGIYV